VWHGSFICVTWLIHMCDMTHSHVWHDSFTYVTWPIRMCGTTHSYVWHDSSICVTWLIHMCDVAHSHMWHGSFICVTWLIHVCDMTHSYVTWLIHMCDMTLHMCDMTHSYVWHGSFTCVTWLIHMCDMTHSHMWHDSFVCVAWLIHMCDMAHPHVWHDSFICVTWLMTSRHTTPEEQTCNQKMAPHIWMRHVTHMNASCHTYEWAMSHIWMSHVTHMNESCHTYECVMSHIWMRRVTHRNASCDIEECKDVNESCDITQSYVAFYSLTPSPPLLHNQCVGGAVALFSLTYAKKKKSCYMSHFQRNILHVTFFSSETFVDKKKIWNVIWILFHTTCHIFTGKYYMSHFFFGKNFCQRKNILHVTHMNSSCHTCECVMWHIW